MRKEKGQSLVELAVSFVLLMLLLGGTVEFGMAYFQFIQLRDAVQEGALYGSINPADLENIELRARGASSSPLDMTSSDVRLSISYSNAPCEGFTVTENGYESYSITVTMEYDHKVFMPFLSSVLKVLPIRATITDTILAPVCR